jgi:hypothetical protein
MEAAMNEPKEGLEVSKNSPENDLPSVGSRLSDFA